MEQWRLNVRKPLPVFEILLKMEVEKPFAFKQVYFHPRCRVLVVKCFVVSNMCHFLKIDCLKNPARKLRFLATSLSACNSLDHINGPGSLHTLFIAN